MLMREAIPTLTKLQHNQTEKVSNKTNNEIETHFATQRANPSGFTTKF